ncbi:MAG: hypothetical protein HN919_04490 [Verrucomicrobia bacterium]|jgi:glycoprotein endo-alpha-1,2-mannosidase|nr:hypothetical protein [Verrucomicrobiota bacterium]MBT7065536.1 hypothetical protein [Verrucomicrobiota bacterium]MBT7700746.1 hypothetical protein [Verrucomicrobiota bacterium]
MRRTTLALFAALVLTACRRPDGTPPIVQDEQILVGAHYHVWYPKNFSQGTLRARLDPPQQPVRGRYDSTDPATAEQHIAWCSQYGIDFLTLDWWPNRPSQNSAIEKGFLQAANLNDIRFCIFYEAWDLAFDTTTAATMFTPAVADRFVAQMHELADRYLSHPRYLHIDGRPVIILYLSRTFSGDFRDAITRARSELAARGVEPFFIGDEIFWGVMAAHTKLSGAPIPARGPQMGRIELFDAIFGYNLYDWSQPPQAGYGAQSDYVKDVSALYDEFSAASSNSVYFIPDIIPGYNDRGVRLDVDSFAIPRRWTRDAEAGSFFAECFDRLAVPHLDPRLNMLFITSFNEWNEDTAIEPLASGSPTRRDHSPGGYDYTQGYRYTGYDKRYLEIIRDKVVALCGTLTTAEGQPAAGITLELKQGRRRLITVSDSRGTYRFARKGLTAGDALLRIPARTLKQPVTLYADRALILDL